MEAVLQPSDTETPPPKKRRGRPPGRRNTPALQRDRLTPPQPDARDLKHADPETLISRQLSMLDWAQQATRNEMLRAYQSKGVTIDLKDIERLESLSNAIVRTIDALKKSSDLADELSKRMTGEQLLEAAIKKIEGQGEKTIKYAIKRLRAYVETLAPITGGDLVIMGERTPSDYRKPASSVIADMAAAAAEGES